MTNETPSNVLGKLRKTGASFYEITKPSANDKKLDSAGLNKLRAAILGANDGIISVATALVAVMGVFGFREIALTAGAVLFAGALSMAAGEYVSVSAQVNHDVERTLPSNCAVMSCEIEHDEKVGPGAALAAAFASFFAFLAGGLLPVLAAIFLGSAIWVIVISLSLLIVTGMISSGKSNRLRNTIKLTTVGFIAFGISFLGNIILHNLGV